MNYKQLTHIQRYQIYVLLKTGQNQATIAKVLNVHRSTISRELRRNKGKRGYRPAQAHRIAIKRHYKPRPRITQADWAIVESKLREDLSPEQVSNWVKEHNHIEISHEWIYQYVWRDKRCKGLLYKHLRRKKKYRKRSGNRDNRGKIPNRIGIEERPDIVDRRERIGDWEVDTIIGKGRKGAMVTLVDRKSRFLRIGLVTRRTKDAVADTIISLLAGLPVHTITCDNGKEFADHEKIALALEAEVYFAHPYASWERGTNENTNGLIRQYFPKDMYFANLSTPDIAFVENRLNSRPRKCLSFAQPMVILNNHCCT